MGVPHTLFAISTIFVLKKHPHHPRQHHNPPDFFKKSMFLLQKAAFELDSYKLFLDGNPFQCFLNPSESDGHPFQMNECEVKDV